jgi:flagellar hook-length control protein FliK
MQTTSLLNPLITANATPSPAQPHRGADQSQPAQAFNQVLSREMADRSKPAASEATRPARHTAPENAKAPQKATSGDKPAKADGARKSDAEDESETTASASDAASSAAAAADMLALVTNIAPVATPVTATEEPVETEVKAEAVADINVAVASADVLRTDPASTRTGRPDAAALDSAAKFTIVADQAGKAPIDARTLPQQGDLKAELKADVRPDIKRAADADTTSDSAETLVTEMSPKTDKAAPEPRTADDIVAKGQALMRGQKDESELPKATREPVQNILQAAQQPSAHAALHAVNSAAVRADHLAPRVGSSGWDQALGQKITWMVAGEQQTASLTLNPPDLGPLQVVLSVSNSQASATFTAAQPEVRQALEAALPKLRDMLGESGIQLGQATVNSGDPQQQQGQFERQAAQSTSRQQGMNSESSTEPAVRTARVTPSGNGRGLVDTFV